MKYKSTLEKGLKKALIIGALTLALPISNIVIGYGVTYRGLSQEIPGKGREIAEKIVREYPKVSFLEKALFYGNYRAGKSYLSNKDFR